MAMHLIQRRLLLRDVLLQMRSHLPQRSEAHLQRRRVHRLWVAAHVLLQDPACSVQPILQLMHIVVNLLRHDFLLLRRQGVGSGQLGGVASDARYEGVQLIQLHLHRLLVCVAHKAPRRLAEVVPRPDQRQRAQLLGAVRRAALDVVTTSCSRIVPATRARSAPAGGSRASRWAAPGRCQEHTRRPTTPPGSPPKWRSASPPRKQQPSQGRSRRRCRRRPQRRAPATAAGQRLRRPSARDGSHVEGPTFCSSGNSSPATAARIRPAERFWNTACTCGGAIVKHGSTRI